MGSRRMGWWLLLVGLMVTAAVYAPGLAGGWIFDDYPNIVDNKGVQPDEASVSSLTRAALSSPSSSFKRPLASLSFALNYLAGGLDPFGWKLVNLVIHLLNGLLVFLLVRMLLVAVAPRFSGGAEPSPQPLSRGERATRVAGSGPGRLAPAGNSPRHSGAAEGRTRNLAMGAGASKVFGKRVEIPGSIADGAGNGPGMTKEWNAGVVAALVASAWLLLPINLTAVLYVVQRMESLANLFVMASLIGYVLVRARMVRGRAQGWRGPVLCATSLMGGTFLGLLVKETAIMLPLYAFLIELLVFRFRGLEMRGGDSGFPAARGPGMTKEQETRGPVVTSSLRHSGAAEGRTRNLDKTAPKQRRLRHFRRGLAAPQNRDKRIIGLFVLLLWLPMLLGLAWQLPHVLSDGAFAGRDFSLATRLLSEARIVVDYIGWSLLPLPQWLSFYHDDFVISTGLLTPWTTLAGILVLVALAAMIWLLRRRAPLVALGIALFLGCHTLTGTILPLELVFEHRNYFASLGLLLAVVPWLAQPSSRLPMAMPRHALLGMLFLWWAAMTAFTAWAWGDPLRLAFDLAARGPHSPRAQYELGRTYILYANYDPDSPFAERIYAPLERAAALPGSSILPEQALIFNNSIMGRPIKDAWWDSMITKLRAHKTGVQDESSLKALTKCAIQGRCELDPQRMLQAFDAALSHPNPSSRLLATFSDWLWNIKKNRALSLEYAKRTVAAEPSEPVYHITLVRMYLVLGQAEKAREQIQALEPLNFGGRLDARIAELRDELRVQLEHSQ